MKNGIRLRGVAATGALAAALLGAACAQQTAPPSSNTGTANGNASVATNAGPAGGTNSNAGAAPAATASVAAQLFVENCAVCHDESGKGKPMFKNQGMPDFTDAAWHARESDEELLEAIRDGKGKIMPAWKGKLSEDEMTSLVAYIRDFPERAPGAADKGAPTNAPAKP